MSDLLDIEYEQAQEAIILQLDWLESLEPHYAYAEDDVFCDTCGDFYPSDDRCQQH